MSENREQIVKALECCSSSDGVSACESGCPYWGGDDDTCPCIEEPNFIIKNALALIKELADENEAWQKELVRQKEIADKHYYDLACEVEDLRSENERLRGTGIPDYKAYIKLSDAKHAIMNYVCEQTVSKYASSEVCKAVRNGAEAAMNELDYITPANVAPIADTVRKMQERLKETAVFADGVEFVAVGNIDQIAKEMVEEQ